MSGIPPTAAMRRRPTQLLVIGIFAMLLHLLAGTGLVLALPSGTNDGAGFVPSVCGSHTALNAAPASESGQSNGGDHDCCKLCAAGAAAATPASALAILPAFPIAIEQAESTTAAAPNPAALHSPRGPPALG